MLGDDHVDGVAAALPGVRHDSSTENSVSPIDARGLVGTTGRNADVNFIRAATARILDAQNRLHGRRRAAAAIIAMTGKCRRRQTGGGDKTKQQQNNQMRFHSCLLLKQNRLAKR